MLVRFATTMGERTHKPFRMRNVNSIPWRNTKSSGIEASGAEHHACAVCDHNGRTDSRAISNG